MPEWQSGEVESYVATYLHAAVAGLFLPWFVFAAMSLGAIVSEPTSASYTVRLGLLAGIVHSAQQILILAVVNPDTTWLLLMILVPLDPPCLRRLGAYLGLRPMQWLGWMIVFYARPASRSHPNRDQESC